ncbi:putative nucleic acid-binding protein [Ancylobacter sp. 3268]|uniref:PIN domain-containing protein n=1 Tax=Ancylobacter sp. 3268 TaxID=2817752 RepID=UPI002863F1B4|nr:PIN domain-containing protein [Ancylobacter sp. 3268]MDR6954745.1 putative nucleic acid-binding protein [Ancylobacter sp. 3268]
MADTTIYDMEQRGEFPPRFYLTSRTVVWDLGEVEAWLEERRRASKAKTAKRAPALAIFNKLVAESFTVLPVTGGQFRAAARFADQHALGLRAGDALHLAVASEHGATVHTLDRRLADAGPALGVPAQLLA